MLVECLWESEGASRLNIHPNALAAVLRDIGVALCRMDCFGCTCIKKCVKTQFNALIGHTGVLEIRQMTLKTLDVFLLCGLDLSDVKSVLALLFLLT